MTEPVSRFQAVATSVGESPTVGSLYTFLIADIRGYTRFTVEHGDEAAARLAARFAGLVRAAVEARGGRVIELRGDEALALFESVHGALHAAVELQDRLARESETDPSLPMHAGIGIDAGEAIPFETGYRGNVLNLAARLCALAGAGEVLTSDGVVHLAHKIEGIEYTERGFAQLKGFTEPVRVIEVKPSAPSSEAPAELSTAGTDLPFAQPGEEFGARAKSGDSPTGLTDPKLPIGGFLGALPSGSLVGREEELRQVLAAVDAVADGSGRFVALTGEPGIGKTRLAQEATLHLRNRGFRVAVGRCYEGDQSVPYYPFREALGMLYAACPPAVRAVTAQWPDVRLLLPGNGAGAAGALSHGEEEQQRLYWSVTGFLCAVADERPVAVLIDDVHWADGASLALLRHLADHTRNHRLLLVGTYRDAEVGRKHPLESVLRDLGREQLVDRINLRRLGQRATTALVADAMGEADISDDLAELVHKWTEGNPFFVTQVLRALVERGDVHRKDGHWIPSALEDIEIPYSVRSVIEQRVSRLDDFTQEILSEASVLGQAFLFDDLHAIGHRDEQVLEKALEEARAVGLIQEAGPDGYAFDHALTQQALYGEVPARRRRRLHLTAGEALEGLPERARADRTAEIAWHFTRGGAGDRALPYSMLAGDQAEAVFAYAEAESYFRTALELAGETGDRIRTAEALEKLGRVLYSLAEVEQSLKMLESAAQAYGDLADAEGEMRTLSQIGWTLYELGRRQEGIDRLLTLLERWRGEKKPSAAAVSGHIALASLYWANGRATEALPLADTASEMARALGDRRLLGDAEGRRGLVLVALNREDEGLEAYAEAIAMADETGDLSNLTRTLNNRAVLYGDRGDREIQWMDMERGLTAARRMGSPIHVAWSLVHLGEVSRDLGDWSAAEAYFDQAVGVLRGVRATRAFAGAELAGLRMLRGEPRAPQQLEELTTTGERTDNLPLYLRANHWLAEWDLLQGRPEPARTRLEAILAHPGLEEQYREASQWALARALLALEELEQMETLVIEQLRRSARPHARADWWQLQGALRVRQERWQEARISLEEALSWAKRSGHVFREALTLRETGLMHLAHGEPEEARKRLNEALAIFRKLGAQPYLVEIEPILPGDNS